jgi:hypothetical protein
VRPRHVIQRGPDVISAATAREIQRIVRELVDTDMPKDPRKGFKKWHEFIKNKCHVQSYLEIPTAQADAIVGLLRQNLARVRSRLHRKGSAERHKDLYRTIWARARELGLSRPQVYALAADTLKLSRVPASLKELGGNQLESFYRFMLGRATGEGT